MAERSNFYFLKDHDPILLELAQGAERAFSADPNTTLFKLRQLAEALAQEIAAHCGLIIQSQTTQADLLFLIGRELTLDPIVLNLFHGLRKAGNNAVHQFRTRHKEALAGLKVARDLTVWYHRFFGKGCEQFSPEPFNVPVDPSAELNQLQEQIAQLKAALTSANSQLDHNQELSSLLAREKQEYQELAELMDNEAKELARQAEEHQRVLEAQQQEFERKLAALQQLSQQQTDEAKKQATQALQALASKAKRITDTLSLDESSTRILIDQQLQDAGWEADTDALDYRKGVRPEKGRNLAIAEWPTQYGGEKGRADYVLFIGLMPVAVVEAKKGNINVAGKIPQAGRYSKGFAIAAPMTAPWSLEKRASSWPDGQGDDYQLPYLYSCNGRPFVKQLAEQSGIWFRDARHPSNLARPLQQFHSPQGLLDLLKRSREQAEQQLKQEGFGYLKVRPYQQKAIEAVEAALAKDQRDCLLAMATGTGKTRTIIGLMYRFLKAERFRRILFLVDRTALGGQAIEAFKEETSSFFFSFR